MDPICKHRISRKRKMKKKKTALIIKFFLALLLIPTIYMASYSFFKMNSSKNKYDEYLTEYNTLLASKESLSKENEKLNLTLNERKTQYEELKTKFNESHAPIAHLTFDDGPSNITIKLLNTLDEFNVKATFFVTYKEGYDDVYREIVNRGHVLANHTYSHDYKKIYSSADAFINDVLALDKKLEEITQKPSPKIVRFPGGSNNSYSTPKVIKEITARLSDLGYTFFDWNVDSTDALTRTQDKNKIVNGVVNGVANVNTANILMHNTNFKGTTIDALPEIITNLKSKGYVFKTLTHDSAAIRFVNY